MNNDLIDAIIMQQITDEMNRDVHLLTKEDILGPPDDEGGYVCEHCELETGYEGDPLEEFLDTGKTVHCPHCSWHLGVEVE